MPIPESQLQVWAKQGSITQSSNTYNTVKNVLESLGTLYTERDCTVFLQGSYGNDTNIYSESDVDIVIQLHSSFCYNIEQLSNQQKLAFNQNYTGSSTYGHKDFKKEVVSHLKKIYGNDVILGDKAIKITANSSRRNTDVIVSINFRNYTYFENVYNQQYIEGMCFFNSDNERIENYPKIHLENCTIKHKNTHGFYKPTVRILKNLRNKLILEKMIEVRSAPSYFLEGLLYNVPNELFGINYETTMVKAINWLLQSTDKSQWVCANGQYSLFSGGSPVTWRLDKCNHFLNAVCDFWHRS